MKGELNQNQRTVQVCNRLRYSRRGWRRPESLRDNSDIGFEIAQGVASIVVLDFKAQAQNRVFLAKQIQRTSKLNLSPARRDSFARSPLQMEGLKDITAEYAETARRVVDPRFFYQTSDANGWASRIGGRVFNPNDSVTLHFLWLDFPNGDDASTVPLVCANQLAGHWHVADHDYIGKEDGKRFLSHQRPGAADCVGKSASVPAVRRTGDRRHTRKWRMTFLSPRSTSSPRERIRERGLDQNATESEIWWFRTTTIIAC